MNRILHLVSLVIGILVIQGCSNPKPASKANPADYSFVFLTDIHVEPGRNAAVGLQRVVDSINKMNPDFVLTGGDLIADALRATEGRADSLYQLYLGIMKELKMPVYNTIGNHENLGWEDTVRVKPDNPLFGQGMYRKHIGE